MTADIRLLVHTPVDAHRVYAIARRVVGIPETEETSTTFYEDMSRQMGWDESHPYFFTFADRRRYLRSQPNGHVAQLTVQYGADGPLGCPHYFTEQQADDHDHDRECDGWSALIVDMSSGGGMGDMLRYFVAEIGAELDRMGAEWGWTDPCYGVFHHGRFGLGAEAVEQGRDDWVNGMADRGLARS